MIRLACLVIVVAGAVAIPSAATAQSSAGDSVTGSLLLNPPDSSPDDTTRYFFDVRSGPSGESPSGTVTLRGRFITDPGAVTCLAVRGNRASIGVSFTGGGFVEPSGSVVFVDDLGGEGQDTIARSVFVGPSTGPAVCPTELPEGVTRPLGPTYPDPLFDGNVAIADAPSLPTTKEQCKDDGWRDYGTTFTNQGGLRQLRHPPSPPRVQLHTRGPRPPGISGLVRNRRLPPGRHATLRSPEEQGVGACPQGRLASPDAPDRRPLLGRLHRPPHRASS